MFDALSDRFDGIFTKLRGRGRLSDADVDEVLREIRLALLEADVNFQVVKNLVARIRERCVGEELSKALSPAQQVIKIVNEELTDTLGGETMRITYSPKPPTVVLMAGLQGSGKTTSTAIITGRVWKFGDNINTDLMLPGDVHAGTEEEQAGAVFRANRPGWLKEMARGDLIIGGRNYGTGSSRPAARSLRNIGIACLVAEFDQQPVLPQLRELRLGRARMSGHLLRVRGTADRRSLARRFHGQEPRDRCRSQGAARAPTPARDDAERRSLPAARKARLHRPKS